MTLEELYHENEARRQAQERETFLQFVAEYHKVSSFWSVDSLFPANINYEEVIDNFYYLRYLVLTYEEKHLAHFFELLQKYGYYMERELFDMLKLVGKEDDLTQDSIDLMLRSPFVQDIKVDSDEVKVTSERYGVFKVISAKNYFKDNINAQSLFSYGDVSHICHTLTATLLHEVDDSKIITSLLSSYFGGRYYHSYLRDKNGMIVDGANKIVLSESDFNRVLKPLKVIDCTRYELYQEYKRLLANNIISEETDLSLPLAVALSKQLTLSEN